MFLLILLHFLPFFLLPYLLILCKKTKKKEKKENEEKKNVPPPAKPLFDPNDPYSPDYMEDNVKYENPAAQEIWKIRNSKDPERKMYENVGDPAKNCRDAIRRDFWKICEIRDNHNCTNPKKSKDKKETCVVCEAYMDWAGYRYENPTKVDFPEDVKRKLDEEFYDYPGQLPENIEHPEWNLAKKRIEKEGCPIDEYESEKPKQISINGVPDKKKKLEKNKKALTMLDKMTDDVIDKIEKKKMLTSVKRDYKKAHKLYIKHSCFYKDHDRYYGQLYDDGVMVMAYDHEQMKLSDKQCNICDTFMEWVGQQYRYSIKDKNYPTDIKKKLERHLHEYEKSRDILPECVMMKKWQVAKFNVYWKRQGKKVRGYEGDGRSEKCEKKKEVEKEIKVRTPKAESFREWPPFEDVKSLNWTNEEEKTQEDEKGTLPVEDTQKENDETETVQKSASKTQTASKENTNKIENNQK